MMVMTQSTWEVGLLLLSMPNMVAPLHDLSDPNPSILIASTVLFTTPHCLLQTVTFNVGDLLGTFCITNDMELMKAIVERVYWKHNHEIKWLGYEVKNLKRATFCWEGEMLILECKESNDMKSIQIQIQATFVQKIGWLMYDDRTVKLGTNLKLRSGHHLRRSHDRQ